jgi:Flp pilus assembly protein protease CpaA
VTVEFVTITVFAVFVSGVIGGVVGLVAVAVHREERNHTLVGPAPDRVTCAARGLNGVYVRAPAVGQASHHRQETLA